jgi:quercetin dioxygenase-like cupin family protein
VKVERWDRTKDGPPSEGALRRKLEAEGYEIDRWVYPPGTRFPTHTHGVDKKDAVVSGRFRLTMGGASVVLEAGDAAEIPRGTPHAAEVVGDDAVVTLDAVRSPR